VKPVQQVLKVHKVIQEVQQDQLVQPDLKAKADQLVFKEKQDLQV